MSTGLHLLIILNVPEWGNVDRHFCSKIVPESEVELTTEKAHTIYGRKFVAASTFTFYLFPTPATENSIIQQELHKFAWQSELNS